MNNKPYAVLMTVMTVTLIGLALWQVYGLMSGDVAPSIGAVSAR